MKPNAIRKPLSIAIAVLALLIAAVLSRSLKENRPDEVLIKRDLIGLQKMFTKDRTILTKEFRVGKMQSHTLVQIAAEYRNPEAVRLLLEAGAIANLYGDRSEQALHLAVQYDCAVCVELLIKHGAYINARGDLGRTALFWAIGNPAVLRILLAAGADCNIKDDLGAKALESARQFGSTDAVAVLSNQCANASHAISE